MLRRLFIRLLPAAVAAPVAAPAASSTAAPSPINIGKLEMVTNLHEADPDRVLAAWTERLGEFEYNRYAARFSR